MDAPSARRCRKALLGLLLLFPFVQGASAKASVPVETETMTARLVTAQDGVARDAGTLSAALHLDLKDGWKTYWRTPGEVGLAPTIDWSRSLNVADVTMSWPAPTRFRAFGIENFGYEDEVAFPLEIELETSGVPVALEAQVSVLACATVCVPETFVLSLTLGPDGGIDPDAAAIIARAADRVPESGAAAGLELVSAAREADRLVVSVRSDRPFGDADVFPEMGETTFGSPDLRYGDDRTSLWALLPVLTELEASTSVTLTVTDGARAATMSAPLSAIAPVPPEDAAKPVARARLVSVLGLAFLGGLVLNLMPCVLPVLSIKLGSVVRRGTRDTARIRLGFAATGLGTLLFVWTLGAATVALKSVGVSVGWGLQFQSPTFVAATIAMFGLFAANLLGLFEIRLPRPVADRIASLGTGAGYGSDLATGALSALLATPCSAPFLGTAIAFALSGGKGDLLATFTALGLGLAAPYFVIALVPGLVRWLPKPGRWMVGLRIVLGVLLLATVAWLVWVLASVAHWSIAWTVAGLTTAAVFFANSNVWRTETGAGGAAVWLAVVGALLAPVTLEAAAPSARSIAAGEDGSGWAAFDRSEIARAMSIGKVVFVDVTADWCLTCKANKATTLDREPVRSMLDAEGVIAMRADWTRPNEEIARYLKANGRYAIPFNAVYGPGAPEGIVLSELLSAQSVMDAVDEARGTLDR